MFQTLISPQDLKTELVNPAWVICDCRFDIHNPGFGIEAFRQGHIPGALYVDLEKDLSTTPDGTNGRHPLPPVQDLVETIQSLGISNHTQVIVYDDEGGGYAVRLWWILRYLGHTHVAVLDGGIQAWVGSGFDLTSEIAKQPLGQFTPEVQEDRLIVVEELQQALIDQEFLLLDSRAPERYRGEEEPIDAVAGHIPGARNHYWRDNLLENGSFKSKAELKDEFEHLLKDNRATDAVIYCGSGVTACHNVLAFVHAGYPLPRLYAGSWSEWTSDDKRGVERYP